MKVGRTKDLVFFLCIPQSADLTSLLRPAHVTSSRTTRAYVFFFDVFKLSDGRESCWSENTKIKDIQTVYISFKCHQIKEKTDDMTMTQKAVCRPLVDRTKNKERIPNYYEKPNTKDQFW